MMIHRSWKRNSFFSFYYLILSLYVLKSFIKKKMLTVVMQERIKAQMTVGLLAFFASVWILFEQTKNYTNPLYAIGIVFLLLFVMLVLAYIIIAILEWINIFDIKTNAILTLIVLTAFMINLTIYF
jgi:hypothetical protein